MIVKLKGFVDLINEDSVHVEVNDIVYRVFVSQKDISKLEKIGDRITVYIHEILREDARYLFGFLIANEKSMFEDLIKVQGVGGKMALNIINQLSIDEIVKSVNEGNLLNFTKISGVGSRLSQRLINELKDKIGKENYFFSDSFVNKSEHNLFLDLSSCLVNLGYKNKTSEDVARNVLRENSQLNLENLIPIALKKLKSLSNGN